jgi:hypothetical protein
MLSTLEHSRWPNRARYMPHIVVGDPSQCEAKVCDGNTITEEYLGILMTDAPDELAPGINVELTLVLMYWPDKTYSNVVPGSTFTLREGPKIVGVGKVLSKKQPSQVAISTVRRAINSTDN